MLPSNLLVVDFSVIGQSFRNIVSLRLKEGKGAQLFLARQFAAAVTALLLIAGAFFVVLFSAADSQAEAPAGSCADAAEIAVLSSPLAPWKGAPLRVVFAAEKPLEGELSLIAPDGKVAAKSRERHGGPPYFWFAEVASPAVGTWHATARARRRAGGVQHDHARNRRAPCPAAAAARDVGERLALARYMESRDGKLVFRMDREALRRAARRGTVVAGAA